MPLPPLPLDLDSEQTTVPSRALIAGWETSIAIAPVRTLSVGLMLGIVELRRFSMGCMEWPSQAR